VDFYPSAHPSADGQQCRFELARRLLAGNQCQPVRHLFGGCRTKK